MPPRRILGLATARIMAVLLTAGALAAPASAQTAVDTAAEAGDIQPGDFWLASLGDSFASGEGNPNNIGAPIDDWTAVGVDDWKWLDDGNCHRSRHAWTFRTARYYAESDAHNRPVRHSFMACSGSSAASGLLGSYTANWANRSPVTHEPQLDRLEAQIDAAGRTPDVVLLSVGGNDVGFADVVVDCTLGNYDACAGNGATVADRLDAMRGVDGRYAQVADRLEAMGVSAERVYLMVYPSPLEGKKRKVFGDWGPEKPRAACFHLSRKRAWRWAEENVVEPLQAAQRAAARRNGWTVIDGHLDVFKRHSYCPRAGLPGADSWWVGILAQFTRQYGLGAFHPNKRGHAAIAEVARRAVGDDVPVGWDIGEPDAPRLPEAADEWAGSYEGRYDGRRARLTFDIAEDHTSMRVALEELERDQTVETVIYPSDIGKAPRTHVIDDLKLTNGGCVSWAEDTPCIRKRIERLLLHTWDKDHISGHSVWRGTEYGLAFARGGIATDMPRAGRLDSGHAAAAWTGEFVGRWDGRQARLNIETQDDGAFAIELVDSGERFSGVADPAPTGPSHILADIDLRSPAGEQKHIDRLYLHTWDVNYISGHHKWRDRPFGQHFVRVSDDGTE